MPKHAIFYDCEFLTASGAMQRFWNGPRDPDPQVVQIGACKLSLTAPFDVIDTFMCYITPLARDGTHTLLDPLFTQLTGITQDTVDANGQPYVTALAQFNDFADGAPFWSWGKDELNLIGTGCMIHGVAPPIPLTRFRNACDLLLAAGIEYGDVVKLRSNTLLAHFDIQQDVGPAHDALADAMQVALSVQHLLRAGTLDVASLSH